MGKSMKKNNKMKSFFAIVVLLAIAATCQTKVSFMMVKGDIPNCVNDLKQDFVNLESAITQKSWSQVGELLKRVTQTYIDCKNAYNEVGMCVNDVKAIISNLFDMYHAVKSHDYNPIHYWNYIKGIYTEAKDLNTTCFSQIPHSVQGNIPQDLSKCYSDMKNEFEDVITAIENKDLSQFDDFFRKFTQTYLDCQAAYNDVAGCATPSIDLVEQVVTLIKAIAEKSMNAMTYIHALEAVVTDVQGIIHNCFNH